MPEVHNPSAQAVLSKTVQLTAADILALGTTPFELVPAPGAGMIVALDACVLVYNFGTHRYEPNVNPGLDVEYAGNALSILLNIIPQTLINAAGSTFQNIAGNMAGDVAILPGSDNKAVQLTGADFHGGPIVTSTRGAGGAGYAANDTGTLQDGNFDATYKVLTVDGGGAVLTYSLTAAGSSYVVANGVTTATGGAQPGAGVGFTINITAVQNGDGTLKVTTFYSIIPVP
jgi:hypothetical protein